MGEGLKQMYSEVSYLPKRIEDEDEDELGESSSLSGSSDDEYESPLDHAATSSSSSSSHGPLHELSSLVSQLPIKRGLSKFYRGKSQSFSSFSDVTHVKDLAKKESLQIMKKKKMMMVIKPSRSYAEGLGDETDENKPSFGGPNFNYNNSCNKREVPRSGRSSCASSVARTTSGCGYFAGGKPPPIPMHKN